MDDTPAYAPDNSFNSSERRSGERRSSAGAQSSSGRARLTSFGEPTSTGGRLTSGEGLPSGRTSRAGPSSYPISPSSSQVHRSRTSSSSSWVNLPPIEPLRVEGSRPHPPPSFKPFPSFADTESGSWLNIPMPEPVRPFAVERQISPPRPLPIPSPHPNARGANDPVPHDPSHFDPPPPVVPLPHNGSPLQPSDPPTKKRSGGFVGGFIRRLPKALKPRPSEKSVTRQRSGTTNTMGSVSTLPRYTSNPSTPDTNVAGLGAGARLAGRHGQMQSIPEIRVPAALSRAPTPPPNGDATIMRYSVEDVPPSLRPGVAGPSTSPMGGGVTVSPIRPLSPKRSSGHGSSSTYRPPHSRPTSGRPDSGTRPDSGLVFAHPPESDPNTTHTTGPQGDPGSPPDDSHRAVQAHLRPAPDYSKMGSPVRPGQPLSLSTTEPSFSSQLGNPITRFFRAVNTMPWVAENIVGSYRPPPPKKKLHSWYRQTKATANATTARRRMSGMSTRTRTTIDLLSSRSPSRLSETSAGLSSPSSPHGDRGNYRSSRPRPRTAPNHRRRHRSPSEIPDVPPLPPGVFAYPYPYGYPAPHGSPKSHSTRTSSTTHRRSGGHRDEYLHHRRRATDPRYPGGYAPPAAPGMFQPSPSGVYQPTPPTPLYVLQSTGGSQGAMSVSLMTPVYAQMPLAAPPAGPPAGTAGSQSVGAHTPQAMPGGMPPPMPVPTTA
ncbi:hypothetical protein EV715DRAFT_285936 [Schizophyllum commune]